ncbi:discoidin domain-containing protein [Pedosphaera parvula]|uniref:Coagulation factor 5/8 type domain protein n=1 Tax=Pedosphaera parvula (strain Ellin514) TaxID=320771 RepID=B9XHK8_PEDPL|nr:discoidin domain-containing protein [Pedosphaera parvula]EEF60586.1 coagulation factor 5/8 type domain protein [Pedosphaera parvula Ellin514]
MMCHKTSNKIRECRTGNSSFQLVVLVIGLVLFSSSANHLRAAGANTPFTTLEAEAGTPGGGASVRAFIPGTTVPNAPTMELEASGLACVLLTNADDSISWTNPVANANAIVIRDCIPDATNGGGITAAINLYVDGIFRQTITLSSKQSWNYRNSTTTPDDPNGGGTPWHFYNEDRALIAGTPVAAGSVITLQNDATNTAAFYDIDSIDLENAPPSRTQPGNSLSIVTYGADPNFTTDSKTAIQNCINAARSQGKTVWIPPGKYMVNNLTSGGLDLRGVTVEGAGMWHSMVYKNIPLPPQTTPWRSNIQLNTNSVLRDISIDSNAIYRDIGGISGDDYGLTAVGNNWLIERVWVQHCDANWLSGSNGIIRDSRVADSWGDGINLNNGNTPDLSKLGISLTASNNFVRGSGDDGFATYSDAGASGTNPQMQNTKIVNNTSIATYWANGIRVAGGTNVVVQNNLVDSVSANNGMEVSIFGNTGNPLDSALISGNVILRGGGWNSTDRHGMHVGSLSSTATFSNAYTRATITNNIIRASLRAGLDIGARLETLIVSHNVIDRPAQQGIWIPSGVTGTGLFEYNNVTNLNANKAAFQNDSTSTFTATLVSNSWQVLTGLLSRGKPATASSYDSGLPGEPFKGNDGNTGTRWSANSPAYPSWWRADLENNCNLTAVTINWYGVPNRSYQYKIEVSTNDVNYVMVVDATGNSLKANTTDTFTAIARYIRITVTGCSQAGGYPSFYECYVYGNVISAASQTPANIIMTASGNTLALSWPDDHLGWRLQIQTNAPGGGLATNWMAVPGSELVTSTNILINSAHGAAFYRLAYP